MEEITVEPGQVWRDNDERSKGAGEFTIVEITVDSWGNPRSAIVRREATGRLSTIRLERLLKGGRRGYTYIGRGR